jgi:hypothetical protein
MSKHNKTADRRPAIPKLVVTLEPEGWEALRLAREVSGIPARTIARRAIAAYIRQPIFQPPLGRTGGGQTPDRAAGAGGPVAEQGHRSAAGPQGPAAQNLSVQDPNPGVRVVSSDRRQTMISDRRGETHDEEHVRRGP